MGFWGATLNKLCCVKCFCWGIFWFNPFGIPQKNKINSIVYKISLHTNKLLLLWIRAKIRISGWINAAPIQTMFRFSHWRTWFLFCFSCSKIESGGCLALFRIYSLFTVRHPSAFQSCKIKLFPMRYNSKCGVNSVKYYVHCSHFKQYLREIPIKNEYLLNSPEIIPNADWIRLHLFMIAKERAREREW